jgi:hypothetical protein
MIPCILLRTYSGGLLLYLNFFHKPNYVNVFFADFLWQTMDNYYKGKNVEEELNTGNIPIGCLPEKYGWLLVGNFKYPTFSMS